MGCGTVAGWETFSGHNEGGRVGAEVEEELGEDVEGEQGVAGEMVIGETDDDKEDGEDGETHDLDGFAAEGVDGCD